jgi:PAS domain S-box-containing protein
METLENNEIINKLFDKITERQEKLQILSEKLYELENQMELIFSSSPDAIVFLKNDGKILKANFAIEKILGYDMQEFLKFSIFDLIHPDDINKTKFIFQTTILKKMVNINDLNNFDYFISRWKKKNGGYAKLAWRFSIYNSEKDNLIGVASDISDYILDSPTSLTITHKIISNCLDGIVITDAKSEDNHMIYVNQSFIDTCGYSKDELIGKNCRILQGKNNKDQEALKTLRESLERGQGCTVLLKNYKKDGSIFYNHLAISVICEKNVVTNFIGISRNFTSFVENGLVVWDKNSKYGFKKIM